MKRNVLDIWKEECYVLSSEYSIKKQLTRADVDTVYGVLKNYFGKEFFEMDESVENVNWIHSLLVNSKKMASVAAIYEIANSLIYLETLSKSFQKKIKSVLNDPRQFRDLFFELFVYRLLDLNNVPNKKKIFEGKRELEGECELNETKYLFECRKLYAPGMPLIENEKELICYLGLKLKTLNKGFGLIGTIIFKNPVDTRIQAIFKEKIDRFVLGFNEKNFSEVNYKHNDEHGEFCVVSSTESKTLEIEKELSKYHIVFKVVPPTAIVPDKLNVYRVEIKAGFKIVQSTVNRKLFDAIKRKVEQHSGSEYKNKIYFIDSELAPDFNLPIFRMNPMFDEKEIQAYIDDTLSENEIVCFVLREYIDDFPKITIKALGKNIDSSIKSKLESLKTRFDYKMKIVS